MSELNIHLHVKRETSSQSAQSSLYPLNDACNNVNIFAAEYGFAPSGGVMIRLISSRHLLNPTAIRSSTCGSSQPYQATPPSINKIRASARADGPHQGARVPMIGRPDGQPSGWTGVSSTGINASWTDAFTD